MAICNGPAGSVWIGYAQSLLRIDTATGAVLARATVPAGLAVSDVAVDPTGRYLYASFAHLVGPPLSGGGQAAQGAAVSEYDATSGGLLTSITTGLITDSVSGAKLVAVPDGVWASLRTGMMGFTILLRQGDLATIAPRQRALTSNRRWATSCTGRSVPRLPTATTRCSWPKTPQAWWRASILSPAPCGPPSSCHLLRAGRLGPASGRVVSACRLRNRQRGSGSPRATACRVGPDVIPKHIRRLARR